MLFRISVLSAVIGPEDICPFASVWALDLLLMLTQPPLCMQFALTLALLLKLSLPLVHAVCG